MTEIRDTEGRCGVCKGQIVEKVSTEYNPMTGPPVFGPGSKRQFKKVSKGYHCKDCGLKYEFIPNKPN